MRVALGALLSGAVFGVGLVIAGMTDPRKVLAFLDLAGPWDPSLAFVLGGAVLVAALAYALAARRSAPVFGDRFHRPGATRIDRGLVIGAALFGVGWGISGYCPGPAIATLAFGNREAWVFVPAMLAGAGLQRWRAAGARSAVVTPASNEESA